MASFAVKSLTFIIFLGTCRFGLASDMAWLVALRQELASKGERTFHILVMSSG